MEGEEKFIKFLIDKDKIVKENLILFEEAPDDEDMVLLEVEINGEKFSCKSDNFFLALQSLREELQKKNIQILCNGSAKNVYPSPMQLSMGSGRMAYKLRIGQQATKEDIVDIFDYEEGINIVEFDEQSKFYSEWLKSIMG